MIEADFQREYGIDLCAELPRLSWRRFMLLLGGLGPNSVLVYTKQVPSESETIIRDPKAAERAVSRVWG